MQLYGQVCFKKKPNALLSRDLNILSALHTRHEETRLFMQTGKVVSFIIKTKICASLALRDMHCLDYSMIKKKITE